MNAGWGLTMCFVSMKDDLIFNARPLERSFQ